VRICNVGSCKEDLEDHSINLEVLRSFIVIIHQRKDFVWSQIEDTRCLLNPKSHFRFAQYVYLFSIEGLFMLGLVFMFGSTVSILLKTTILETSSKKLEK
jgi:hypothetical protein